MRKSQKHRPIILGCLCEIAGYSHCATVHLRLDALCLCMIETHKQDESGLKMKVLCHIIGIWISIGGDLKVLCHLQCVLNLVAESGCVMGGGEKTLKRAPALCSGALMSKKGSERAPRVHLTMSSPLGGQEGTFIYRWGIQEGTFRECFQTPVLLFARVV